MSKYFYKSEKRVKRVSDDISKPEIDKLKELGYVEVSDRRDPENSIIKTETVKVEVKSKPKPKPKPKAKAKKKVKKK